MARLEYGPAALENHVLRRVHLVRAGAPLGGELAVDSAWANTLAYTFIARRPAGEEDGIRSVRSVRDGVPLRGKPRGLHRARPGLYRLDEGYHIVDVFDEWDRHLGSVVVDPATSPRRILQHLGCAHRQSDAVDRLQLGVRGILHWRALLPDIVRSGGYGPLLMRPRTPEERAALADPADSIAVTATRYQLEELESFTLVGRDGEGERYRHVFTAGGNYLMTAIGYGPQAPAGEALLSHLGLVGEAATSAPDTM